MKELPAEMWGMVARDLRREPPPVGVAANWNDHFHQQDLVNLMRVDQFMYKVASAVLYESPIVQDMGMLLQGVEQPFPRTSLDGKKQFESEHKQTLLGKIKKLYIIHHSSNKPLGPVFMWSSAKTFFNTKLDNCQADKLGQRDLKAWMRAEDLANRLCLGSRLVPTEGESLFGRLQSLAFGSWDDGRWDIYTSREAEDLSPRDVWDFRSDDDGLDDSESQGQRRGFTYFSATKRNAEAKFKPRTNACPNRLIDAILNRIFHNVKLLNLCYDPLSLLRSDSMADLTLLHQVDLNRRLHAHVGRTRTYATIKYLRGDISEFGSLDYATARFLPLSLDFDHQGRPAFRARSPTSDSESDHDDLADPHSGVYDPPVTRRDLELCLLPELEGDEGDLQLARDVRDAWTKYEEASQKKDQTNGYLGTFKILVGDDIPACPCCGGKR